MNLRKGILRIVVLTLWLAFGIGFFFVMLPLLFRPSSLDIVFLLTIFEVGFYLPAWVIIRMNSAYPLREQVFDSDSMSFKLFLVIAAIAGVIGFAIYSHIEPYGWKGVGDYMWSLLAPFILVFGSYIYVCWIIHGFRSHK
jgi:hypothetical protein